MGSHYTDDTRKRALIIAYLNKATLFQ